MIRVLFLCLGNICRSPLAEAAFRAHVEALGQGDRFVIDSAGTSGHHAGEPPNPGSVRVARTHGLDIRAQRSRKLVAADLCEFDYIVPMDRSNQRALTDLPAHRRPLVREFDAECLGTPDVPDPWGGGPEGFEEVWDILARSVPGLLEHIQHHGKQV